MGAHNDLSMIGELWPWAGGHVAPTLDARKYAGKSAFKPANPSQPRSETRGRAPVEVDVGLFGDATALPLAPGACELVGVLREPELQHVAERPPHISREAALDPPSLAAGARPIVVDLGCARLRTNEIAARHVHFEKRREWVQHLDSYGGVAPVRARQWSSRILVHLERARHIAAAKP